MKCNIKQIFSFVGVSIAFFFPINETFGLSLSCPAGTIPFCVVASSSDQAPYDAQGNSVAPTCQLTSAQLKLSQEAISTICNNSPANTFGWPTGSFYVDCVNSTAAYNSNTAVKLCS